MADSGYPATNVADDEYVSTAGAPKEVIDVGALPLSAPSVEIIKSFGCVVVIDDVVILLDAANKLLAYTSISIGPRLDAQTSNEYAPLPEEPSTEITWPDPTVGLRQYETITSELPKAVATGVVHVLL
jgi:hypothetical protein